jgi:hypothetical protein
MRNTISIKTIILLFIATIAGYGCADSNDNKKAQQVKLLQEHISTIASACTGTLSISSQLTGDPEKPITTTVNCSEMDKEHDFFRLMTDKDVEEIKDTIRKLN